MVNHFEPMSYDDVSKCARIIERMAKDKKINLYEFMMLSTQLKVIQTLGEIREAVINDGQK